MTAKTLEKVPVSLGGFVHPSETVYGEEMASVAGFPPADLGGHYDHMSGATGENRIRALLGSVLQQPQSSNNTRLSR